MQVGGLRCIFFVKFIDRIGRKEEVGGAWDGLREIGAPWNRSVGKREGR